VFTAGIDVGSVATKVVLLNENGVSYYLERPTGWNPRQASHEAYQELLHRARLDEAAVTAVVATGYGRIVLSFADWTATEITCHARGARYLVPEASLVIDIGGQDSKVIRIAPNGRVLDFVMNDKCAAGTGRFLTVLATALGVEVGELGALGREAEPAAINSMCTVFAESEVVGLLAEGVPKEQIARGLHEAIARRLASMAKRLGYAPGAPIAFTGGVARNPGVRQALEKRLGVPLVAPELCQFSGALGAALLARERPPGRPATGHRG
jgi:predicted CoA-substrate-specific enzyme activase